jgi:hypothetical protein
MAVTSSTQFLEHTTAFVGTQLRWPPGKCSCLRKAALQGITDLERTLKRSPPSAPEYAVNIFSASLWHSAVRNSRPFGRTLALLVFVAVLAVVLRRLSLLSGWPLFLNASWRRVLSRRFLHANWRRVLSRRFLHANRRRVLPWRFLHASRCVWRLLANRRLDAWPLAVIGMVHRPLHRARRLRFGSLLYSRRVYSLLRLLSRRTGFAFGYVALRNCCRRSRNRTFLRTVVRRRRRLRFCRRAAKRYRLHWRTRYRPAVDYPPGAVAGLVRGIHALVGVRRHATLYFDGLGGTLGWPLRHARHSSFRPTRLWRTRHNPLRPNRHRAIRISRSCRLLRDGRIAGGRIVSRRDRERATTNVLWIAIHRAP